MSATPASDATGAGPSSSSPAKKKVKPSVEWWVDYGPEVGTLSAIAQGVLTLPPTSSSAERNWSAFKHIWTDNRSRLNISRVGMLVYIYFNHRVLNRAGKQANAMDWEGFVEYLKAIEEEAPLLGAAAGEITSLAELGKMAARGDLIKEDSAIAFD